jgi:NTE family protein
MTDGSPRQATLNLALQGGGAHGAFTWGVLDALLADGRFAFEGVSGTSAGAMNAVCLGAGWARGGREGAREQLAMFWEAVAASSPFAGSGPASGDAAQVPAAMRLMLQWTAHLSPSQINPFDINPLRDILAAQIDFDRLRTTCPLRLFIAATHANSGQLRIFDNRELSLDALLASACLPTIHHTVMIDGEPYWDGGYSANPAIYPLFWRCQADDILLVLLSPLKFAATPVAAGEIRERLQELAFNNTFLREMRGFAHLAEQASQLPRRWWQPHWLTGGPLEQRVAQKRFHAITTESVLDRMPAESRLAVNLPFFHRLRDAGREQAKAWLDRTATDVGRRPTLDLARLFY